MDKCFQSISILSFYLYSLLIMTFDPPLYVTMMFILPDVPYTYAHSTGKCNDCVGYTSIKDIINSHPVQGVRIPIPCQASIDYVLWSSPIYVTVVFRWLALSYMPILQIRATIVRDILVSNKGNNSITELRTIF